MDGMAYGLRGHLNGDFLLLDYGFGAFMQFAKLDYDLKAAGVTSSVEADKTTVGLDGYLKLDMPAIPIKPYLRLGLALYDKVEVDKLKISENENLKSYYAGLGVAFTVLPLPAVDIQLFGEYLYNTSEIDNVTYKDQTINVGVLLGF